MATDILTRGSPEAPGVDSSEDRLCLRIPVSISTLAGFRAWVKSDEFPDPVRVAYLDKEIYLDISKEGLETHNKVKIEVARDPYPQPRTRPRGVLR